MASQVLVGVADQAVRRDRPLQAARLLVLSEAVGGGSDLSRPDGARVEEAVRAALGEPAFTEAKRQAREGLAGAWRGELATVEAVREVTSSVLGPVAG